MDNQPSEDPQERLVRQLIFVREIDRLKEIVRRNWLVDGSRRENDAEHSWHLAVLAMVFHEYAEEPGVDIAHVIKMLLIHDVIEIDAGDTYAYDASAQEDKEARELAAAERIFGLLPEDQAEEFRDLWDEFEECQTPEARFAASLDRLLPLMQNYDSGGFAWRENNVGSDQVRDRMKPVGEGSGVLGEVADWLINSAVERGYLRDGER